ncbi:MAG TPA: Ig domain-containing protein [bacterium]|nr:Ig domain-containing protein [bacterium]
MRADWKRLLPVSILVLAAAAAFVFGPGEDLLFPSRASARRREAAEREASRAKNPYLEQRRGAPLRGRPRNRADGRATPRPAPTLPPLEIVSLDIPMGVVGTAYEFRLQVRGARGKARWFLAAGELPPGLELAEDGTIAGVPEDGGEWRFTVAVREGGGRRARRAMRMIVRVDSPGSAPGPVIVTEDLPPAVLGVWYQSPLSAEGGTPPYSWALVSGSLPGDIRLQPRRGVLLGLPRELGDFEVSFEVADRGGDSDTSNFTLRVAEGVFRIVTEALPPGTIGEPYSCALRAEGGVPPYSWRLLAGELPPRCALDGSRGIVAGTSSEEGEYRFTVRAQDSQGRQAERDFLLAIAGPEGPGGLYGGFKITTRELAPAVRGSLYAQSLTAEGGTPPYTWTVSVGNLPPGLYLASASGEIGGIPEEAGIFDLRILAADRRSLTAQADFRLTVGYEQVQLTGLYPGGSDEAEVRIGREYQFEVGVTGGSPPYTFSLVSGSLPEYLVLDPNAGIIFGTVSDAYAEASFFSFRVLVADSGGGEIAGDFQMKVLTGPTPTPTPRQTPEPVSPTPGTTPSPRRTSTPAGGVPTPKTTPSPAQGELEIAALSCAVSSRTVGLAWDNPHEPFREISVIRNSLHGPRGPLDGEEVYVGGGESYLDTGLEDGSAYHYAVVVYDLAGLPGPLGEETVVSAVPLPVSLNGENDPCADHVVDYAPLDPASAGDPEKCLGVPRGGGSWQGSRDVAPLHALRAGDPEGPPYGGSITLKFDNLIADGTGEDFSVFENVFYLYDGGEARRWMEPAVVSVSRNGIDWKRFPFNYFPTSDLSNPYNYNRGFAGVNPVYSNGGYPDPTDPSVSGGDQFDISELGLDWIQYIRIQSTGDLWLEDENGDLVRHTAEMDALSGTGASGFDLDAACAVIP